LRRFIVDTVGDQGAVQITAQEYRFHGS
jgi:hypothetical protein